MSSKKLQKFSFKNIDNYTENTEIRYIPIEENLMLVWLYKDNFLAYQSEKRYKQISYEEAKEDMVDLLLTGQLR